MHLSGVRSVCPSMGPQQQTRCCRFAAAGPAGRIYRLIAAWCTAEMHMMGKCSYCHFFVSTDLFTIAYNTASYFPVLEIHSTIYNEEQSIQKILQSLLVKLC